MNNDPKSKAAAVALIFFVAMAALAAYFGVQGDYVLAGFLGVAAFGAICGFHAGALQSAASIGGFALAAFAAPFFGHIIEPHLSKAAGTTGLINRAMAIGIMGVAIIIAVSIAVSLVSSMLFSERSNIADLNRWGGFLFGGAQGFAAVLLLLGGLLTIEPMQRSRQTDYPSPVAKAVLAASDYTRKSRLGDFVMKYNPFKMFPQLNKIEQIQNSMQTLSDPRKIDRILSHPEVAQLRKDPKFEKALATLKQDKDINQILQSREPMSQEKIMTIMNSQAVLNLIDQPGFLESAAKVMNQAGS